MSDPAADARDDARWAGILAVRDPAPMPADLKAELDRAAGIARWPLGLNLCWQCSAPMGEPPGECERCGWCEASETEWNE